MVPPREFRVLLVSILLVVYCSLTAAAEDLPRQIRFDQLSVDEGLSNASVAAIVQDAQGLMWFATQGGLNRYDGTAVRVFEHDPFDHNSPLHNQLQSMYLDTDDTLWIGTYGGLNHFDPESSTFRGYAHDPDDPTSISNNVVVAIERDAAGRLWVGTLDGLNRFDEESASFVHYSVDSDDPAALPDKVIRSLHTDILGTLWVGTYGGLSRYIPESDRFETFAPKEGNPESLPTPYAMTIIDDRFDAGALWIGMWGGGIVHFDSRTGTATTFSLDSNEVYTILQDSAGRVWAGTWGGGLFLLDPATGDNVRFRHEDSGSGTGLGNDVVYSLCEDDSGIVWIGTNGGGINKYVSWENRAEFLTHRTGDETSISSGKINTLLENPNGTLLVGVYNGGLNLYDPETRASTHFRYEPDNPRSLSNDIVNAVTRDSSGRIWVGTNAGLNIFSPERGDFERIYSDGTDQTPSEDIINEIFEDSQGNLWLGTFTSGLSVRWAGTNSFDFFPSDSSDPRSLSDGLVRSILEDHTGTIWVGTNNGLNRYLPEERAFQRYTHNRDDSTTLANNDIRDIFESTDNTLWIATSGGGIDIYNRTSDTFSAITKRNGLVSNQVLAIVEDNEGSMWFATTSGITVYDPVDGNVITYNRSNGLLSNEMTDPAIKTQDGRLYFGTVAGVAVFDWAEVTNTSYTPPIVLNKVEVFGKPVTASDELVLNPDETFFSFEFAALDYASPEQNQYAYRLDGFDSDWNYVGTRNYGRYTNLNPGRYTLRIIGAGSRGNWNREGVSLDIRVLTPWWHTAAAYFAYALIMVSLVGTSFVMIGRRQQKMVARVADLNQKIAKRTTEIEEARTVAEKATEAKSLFLANMSHEIRTPLNGILGMLSLLQDDALSEKQLEYVNASVASANKLKVLVSDLLDFESIESGRVRMSVREFCVSELVASVARSFEPQVRAKNLAFDATTKLLNCSDHVLGDVNRIEQILNNLVSNAVKYTETGSISLSASAINGEKRGECSYVFAVSDSGIGIPEDRIDGIFESFIQLDVGYTKTSKGVGLGLAIVKQLADVLGGSVEAESKEGAGSTFRVTLPMEASKEIRPEGTRGSAPKQVVTGAYRELSPGTTVLICEDEAINRMYLQQILKRRGFDVHLAADGEEAVERVRDIEFGAVLMDLSMPKMNGLDATKAIRALYDERETERRLPILALTAHTQREDIQKCIESGMDDYLSKPVNEVELMEKLLGALQDS